ncbi:hypothetical protein FRC03_011010 [Tulasnella sp. 419]|nr:hypothetical protein FRC03_011010 [Tulasnella sp. 419]
MHQILRRGYATRAIPRHKDPLIHSSNAVHVTLPEGVTFIHRPPPSAPTPESLATNPSSPLLRPLVKATESSTLPPSVRNATYSNQSNHLTAAQIEEIQQLRRTNPQVNTVSALAKKFNCAKIFVSSVAPLDKESRAKREEALRKRDERSGENRKIAKAVRQKRRELW